VKVELDIKETGYLCDMVLERILAAGAQNAFLFWVVELYSKLASANCAMGRGEKK